MKLHVKKQVAFSFLLLNNVMLKFLIIVWMSFWFALTFDIKYFEVTLAAKWLYPGRQPSCIGTAAGCSPFPHPLCQYQAVLWAPGIFSPWIALYPGWVPLTTLSEVHVQLLSGSRDLQGHREDPAMHRLLLSERDQFVVTHWGPRLESLSEAEGTAGTKWL